MICQAWHCYDELCFTFPQTLTLTSQSTDRLTSYPARNPSLVLHLICPSRHYQLPLFPDKCRERRKLALASYL